METGTALLLAGVGIGGVYLLTRPRSAASGTTSPPAAAGSSGWSGFVGGIENAIQGKTGVPIAAIGNLASSAPTWLKVAVLPVGATAVAQKVITHPVDTAKSALHALTSIF